MPGTGTVARLALAAAVLLTAGCSDPSTGTGPADAGTTASDIAAWTSTDPVDTSGLIWAADGVVHLSDGTTIEVGGPLSSYVVAGDGVWFTPADSEEAGTEHSTVTTGPLHFADRDGEVTDTGLTVYVESIGASPDGRYLGLVDATSGQEDDFSGTPQATAVVVDLSSGERVVDTTDGMGDPAEDDLAHDYPEVHLSVRFPDTGSAYVEGLGENRLYALPGGESEVVDPVDSPVHDPLDRTNHDGTWTIDDRGDEDVLRSADGERVRPRTGTSQWELGWWQDARTVVAAASDGGPSTLVTCVVPSGDCTPVEGTAGLLLRFPEGVAPSPAVDLGGGDA
jgi:hypothetical protein